MNFKDSLASKKDGGVIRNYPMIPGIDVSGTVVTSEDPRFKEGDKVIVTGYQLGVSHTGGYSEYVRVLFHERSSRHWLRQSHTDF